MSNSASSGSRPMILIAEDDADSIFYFSMVLRNDYDLETAISVEDALKIMRRRRPDLILLDLSLEGDKDGLDLVRTVRRTPEWKDIPIVAATAHAFNKDEQNCLKAGCNVFLSKPIKMKQLIDTVQSFFPS